MKKPRRFQTVPVAEVLRKAVEVDGKPLEKLPAKEEPYAVVRVKAVTETVRG